MKEKVAFLTLGCKVNSYETEAMRGIFEENGYESVDFKEIADIYVVNTCTVTHIADRKSRQMLRQAKKRNPEAIIIAVGCYVQSAEEELLEDSAVDIVLGNNKKSDIINVINHYKAGKGHGEYLVDINKENEYEDLNVATALEKTRAVIKIQDGCNRFCSYCIIPYVRGRVRSRKMEDVLDEVKRLADNGYKEFVLTGIHLSSYGIDFPNTKDIYEENPLAKLIVEVANIAGVERIRLGSLEPRIITRKFASIIASVDEFCPHFHLSLQSGSNSVLERMNRKYTSEEYYDKILLLREYFEKPAFTTDVIVGFPGETDEEFKESLEFVKKIGFSYIHVFKYSKRKGTVAYKMDKQVDESVKNNRRNILIEAVEDMSNEYKASFKGRIEKILIEETIEIAGKSYQVGHNERYLKLGIESNEDLSNQIISAKVIGDLNEDILLCI